MSPFNSSYSASKPARSLTSSSASAASRAAPEVWEQRFGEPDGGVPLLFRVLRPVAKTDQHRRTQRNAEDHGIAVVLPPGFQPFQIFLFFVCSQDVTLARLSKNNIREKSEQDSQD